MNSRSISFSNAKRGIVLNIPHSSSFGVFDETIGRWPVGPGFYNECVRKLTDWYTDILFHPEDKEIKSIVFPYSRFVCDVERLDDDPMESIGQGILYTKYQGYTRGIFTSKERENILQLRTNHRRKLSQALSEDAVLIDCHSFPSEFDLKTDICIGFNDDWSYDERLVDMIKSEFEHAGYHVSLNKPYSNSITPQCSFPYKSVMIEVNKKVYMDEYHLLLNNNPEWWENWSNCINRIYQKIRR